MNDIQSRADIDLLMRVFYERALADDVIGYIFSDVAKLDLEHHLPVTGDFPIRDLSALSTARSLLMR